MFACGVMPWAMTEQSPKLSGLSALPGRSSRADRGCTAPRVCPDVQPLPVGTDVERAVGADDPVPPAGLVDSGTSHVPSECLEVRGISRRAILRLLDRRKRLKRMRRSVMRFADEAQRGMSRGGFRTRLLMVTLTYRDIDGWAPGHISKYVQRATEYLERRGHSYAYAWTIEMQTRGAPHYHVLFWLREGARLPMPDRQDRRARSRMWPHGSSRIEIARSPGYIVKYASKGEEDPLPFGARIFGIGANERGWRRVARWFALPAWLRDVSREGDQLSRMSHVGWINRNTGELHESQWTMRAYRDGDEWVIAFERRTTTS